MDSKVCLTITICFFENCVKFQIEANLVAVWESPWSQQCLQLPTVATELEALSVPLALKMLIRLADDVPVAD